MTVLCVVASRFTSNNAAARGQLELGHVECSAKVKTERDILGAMNNTKDGRNSFCLDGPLDRHAYVIYFIDLPPFHTLLVGHAILHVSQQGTLPRTVVPSC
jgi:hypothetical protein